MGLRALGPKARYACVFRYALPGRHTSHQSGYFAIVILEPEINKRVIGTVYHKHKGDEQDKDQQDPP